MLQTKYHKNIHIILNFIHNINQIIIHILRSHHHKALHQDKTICKKKKINIPKAQIIQLKIVFSDKFVSGKYILYKYKEINMINKIKKS